MADVYVNALTQQTTEPATTDSIVLVNRNTNEGKIIDYNLLADVILAKLASKQFPTLTTASKLIPGAINELDADAASMASSISTLNNCLQLKLNAILTERGKTFAEHIQSQLDAGNLPIGSPFLAAITFYERGIRPVFGYLYLSNGATYGGIMTFVSESIVALNVANGVVTQTTASLA